MSLAQDSSGSPVDEYDEVVEEVTDEEDGEAPGPAPVMTPVASPPPATPAASTAKPTSAIGKVTPSEDVKNMKIHVPNLETSPATKTLKAGKNPFERNGLWTPTTFAQIKVTFPVLDSKCESTNELTRANKPENRYWKGTIRFGFGGFVSETIRFHNVHIPYISAKGYGSNYAYFSLPGFCADFFQAAGKERRPTIVHENRVIPDREQWWKIGNNLDGRVGVITDGNFEKLSLEALFASSTQGVKVNLIARFIAKAHTEDRSALKPTTPCSVAMEVVRVYVADVGVDVEPPKRTERAAKVENPLATSSDVATDSLMERLRNMGL